MREPLGIIKNYVKIQKYRQLGLRLSSLFQQHK